MIKKIMCILCFSFYLQSCAVNPVINTYDPEVNGYKALLIDQGK